MAEPKEREDRENLYISCMKHCIGLDNQKPYKRHGRLFYKPYRNYFSTAHNDEAWEVIEGAGYAKRGQERNGCVSFYLTEKGKAYLGEKLGIKIKSET